MIYDNKPLYNKYSMGYNNNNNNKIVYNGMIKHFLSVSTKKKSYKKTSPLKNIGQFLKTRYGMKRPEVAAMGILENKLT